MYSFLCLATIQRRENGVSFSENVNAEDSEVLTNDEKGYNDRIPRTYMFVVDSLFPGHTWVQYYINKTMVTILYYLITIRRTPTSK